MTTHRTIAVSEWSKSPAPVIRHGRDTRRFWPPRVIGLAGTLLLHGLTLPTAIFSGRAHRIPPPEVRNLGSTQFKTAPAESLVFIDIPSPAKTNNQIDDPLASARAAIVANPVRVRVTDLAPALDATPLVPTDDKDAETNVPSGDGAEHARLLGIYSGQIQARVERIWIRPRTSVNEGNGPANSQDTVEFFHCQAQIAQDAAGTVQEVLLPSCNGSAAWQHSLVVAIQQASPLPAPPSPRVFSRIVNLNFIGYSHITGGSDEGYETSTIEAAQVTLSSKIREEISR